MGNKNFVIYESGKEEYCPFRGYFIPNKNLQVEISETLKTYFYLKNKTKQK